MIDVAVRMVVMMTVFLLHMTWHLRIDVMVSKVVMMTVLCCT